MMRISKFASLALAVTFTVLSGIDAHADDSEVFFSDAATTTSTSKANILLILDTSGSMNQTAITETEVAPYKGNVTYSANSANCDDDYYYYWPTTNGILPSYCNAAGMLSFAKDQMKCNAANTALGNSATAAGYYGGTDRFIRLRRNSGSNYTWQGTLNLGSDGRYVECFGDNGTNGLTTGNANKWPKNTVSSAADNNAWTSNSAAQWWSASNVGTTYYLFSPNYIRYQRKVLNGSAPATVTRFSRMDVVKSAVTQLLTSVSNVNIGLMRYDRSSDSSGEGGMVTKPVQELTDAYRTELITAVEGFEPSGGTPLSETLYEAYMYLSGGAVGYGSTSRACTAISNGSSDANGTCSSGAVVNQPSVAESRTGGLATSTTYRSPLAASTSSCAVDNNHIIYLTDGLPTGDTGRNGLIRTLAGVASCPDADGDGTANSDGDCLALLSEYMYEHNMQGNGTKITSHYIGFGADVVSADAVAYLTGAATAGTNADGTANDRGTFHSADNIASLTTAFNAIVETAVADTSATFTSPSVAVNSFNKTQVLEDMYVAMFKPTTATHWEGNLKKFKLRPIDVVDTSTNPDTVTRSLAIVGKEADGDVATESAVDESSGFFSASAQDFWQAASDTNPDITTKGGAANLFPAPFGASSRNVYTYLSNVDHPSAPFPLLSAHPFNTSNAALNDTWLGTVASPGCGTDTNPCRNTLINWARGDADGLDTTTDDFRFAMGDPIHSQPAVVIYANSAAATATNATLQEKVNDALVFVATNDGYLHAIDVVTGIERWSFIPKEMLGTLKSLYIDAPNPSAGTTKHYSLDGDIRVLQYDSNNDGKIDVTEDRVILYVSQGRGGDSYYALDITNKNAPRFLWRLSSAADSSGDADKTFNNIVSKSWSTPTLARIKVGDGSAQNSQRLVLVFGGGYDDMEDNQNYTATGNGYGNALYMVDAVKGTILWRQTKVASGTSAFTKMTHAIPSAVTVIDTEGDGWTDRMYVGDMAGQIWRFDITNGNSATGTGTNALVAGGVIASLGAKAEATPTVANNRSFYNQPDVAKFIVRNGPSYYNIAIGSGDRASPRSNTTTQDRFYSIRDYRLGKMTQSTYDTLTPVIEGNLATVTGTSAATFASDSSGWKINLSSTEKALAQSITVDGVVMFTTFIAGTASSATSCLPTTGSGRAYSINVKSGVKHFDELYESFNTTGLPPTISPVDPSRIVRTTADGDDDDDTTDDNTHTAGKVCVSGVVILGNCVAYGSRLKTFWLQSGSN